ncbi:hypothetical protein EYF80_003525 [Liparis tanakae]|uniref:Uncharacterized protein n=1 Tax=Liparis tanakae TaxID=230148 RepID=A0A4Z2J8T4_9TELE|nr:hypothetical protein EYF80_003525 [Liparis tanakae]
MRRRHMPSSADRAADASGLRAGPLVQRVEVASISIDSERRAFARAMHRCQLAITKGFLVSMSTMVFTMMKMWMGVQQMMKAATTTRTMRVMRRMLRSFSLEPESRRTLFRRRIIRP